MNKPIAQLCQTLRTVKYTHCSGLATISVRFAHDIAQAFDILINELAHALCKEKLPDLLVK